MTELTSLHEALLELGLEDLIPLPEIRSTQEIRTLPQGEPGVEAVAQGLADLLREQQIQVWCGHWSAEPTLVSSDNAEPMLLDERRYSFDAEEELGLERVYYANVRNIRC